MAQKKQMQKRKSAQAKQGFTIIEVVLVLAIAGLIFLMVFVALPALQRSQRDTQRRNDMARIDTSLTQYQTNNQGTNNGTNLPEAGKVDPVDTPTMCDTDNSACKFLKRYMNAGDGSATTNTFQDPDGKYYGIYIFPFDNKGTGSADTGNLKAGTTSSGKNGWLYNKNDMDHNIYIVTSAVCDGEAAVNATARHYAVLYRLEGSGVYCIDDQ